MVFSTQRKNTTSLRIGFLLEQETVMGIVEAKNLTFEYIRRDDTGKIAFICQNNSSENRIFLPQKNCFNTETGQVEK